MKKEYTASEMGKKGGPGRVAQIGRDGMAKMGAKGGKTNVRLHGREHMAAIGRAGALVKNKNLEKRKARKRV